MHLCMCYAFVYFWNDLCLFWLIIYDICFVFSMHVCIHSCVVLQIFRFMEMCLCIVSLTIIQCFWSTKKDIQVCGFISLSFCFSGCCFVYCFFLCMCFSFVLYVVFFRRLLLRYCSLLYSMCLFVESFVYFQYVCITIFFHGTSLFKAPPPHQVPSKTYFQWIRDKTLKCFEWHLKDITHIGKQSHFGAPSCDRRGMKHFPFLPHISRWKNTCIHVSIYLHSLTVLPWHCLPCLLRVCFASKACNFCCCTQVTL